MSKTMRWLIVPCCMIIPLATTSAFVGRTSSGVGACTFFAGIAASPSSSSSLSMALTLYGSQGSRSPLVNWALYELDLDFDMGDLANNPHPFGQIPCLVDTGSSTTTDNDHDDENTANDKNVVVFESGAILVYLSSLASLGGTLDSSLDESQKAQVLSWVAWANASLDPICFLETPDGKVYDTGLKRPNRRIDKLDALLKDRQFLLGNERTAFTVADVAVSSYLLYVLQFFPDVDLSRWPNLVRYMTECASRPAYGKAFGERIQSFLVQALADMDKPKSKVGGLLGMF